MRKRIIILGSTGSIGTSTLDVIRDFPSQFEVVGLSTHSNSHLLGSQAQEFSPQAVCISNPEAEPQALPAQTTLFLGEEGLAELVNSLDADMLVVATVGFAGLFPTLAGIEKGMTIALANKEVLVVAGEIVMQKAREAGVKVLPIDSEHNAIFQCLAGNDAKSVRRIFLTASGGPLRNLTRGDMASVTVEQALNHPTWNMGRKITIDCASLMNKGLEVIEACHLFGLSPDQVEVVVHPQSTIHSMVEYRDGSVLAQLGQTSMYLPILNVLSYPQRFENKFAPLNLAALGQLSFSAPQFDLFPCLGYAYEAIRAGGTMPAAMNAANEIAVSFFLDRAIPFMGIAQIIRKVMDNHEVVHAPDLNNLRGTDFDARKTAREYAANLA